MDEYSKLHRILTASMTDFKKFYGENNKAAGGRVRKAMMELVKAAKDVRVDVQDRKKTL